MIHGGRENLIAFGVEDTMLLLFLSLWRPLQTCVNSQTDCKIAFASTFMVPSLSIWSCTPAHPHLCLTSPVCPRIHPVERYRHCLP